MKKALMNASVASMLYQFNLENIEILESLGYQVDVACNFGKENPISKEQIHDFKSILKKKQIRMFNTSCPRTLFAIGKMLKTYKQLKKIADTENYDLVHTQSPIGGVICRMAFRKARKHGTKVLYTAHGFHFYKGAPIQNWLMFYPIEKVCSRFTDVLITINKEDYVLAKKKMKAKKVVYVPGVGIDLEKFSEKTTDKEAKRNELRIPKGAVWILAVGELIPRKNHENLIRALKMTENTYLTIAGKGELQEHLLERIETLGLTKRVKLLGFRTDISELCEACDLFAFPSFQEGLPVALMEAMASGRAVVCSKIRGNQDLLEEGKGGFFFEPSKIDEISNAINLVIKADRKAFGEYNLNKIRSFDLLKVLAENKELYGKIARGGYETSQKF